MAKFLLNERELREHVGDEYFDRGRDYYRRRCVMGATFDPREGTVHGLVQGGEPKPYRTVIALDADGIAFSMCSCPMEEGCKHVAALGLSAIDEIPRFKRGVADDRGGHDKKKTGATKSVAKKADWRSVLSGSGAAVPSAGGSGTVSRNGNVLEPCYAEVELLFRLEEIQLEPWRLRGSPVQLALQVRPRVMHPATGKRSLAAVQWKDFRYASAYQHYRRDQAPLPARAEKFLRLFARQLDLEPTYQSGYSYSGVLPAWADVARGSVPLLWPLIDSHEDYGVTLTFGEDPSVPVMVSRIPIVPAVVIKDGAQGEVTLAKQMLFPGRATAAGEPGDTIIVYGDPPVFALVAGREHAPDRGFAATFFPIAKKYDEATFRSLERPISVPAADVPEFRKKFLPQLMRRVMVESSSSTIAVPESVAPKLIVKVGKTGLAAISVGFGLRYRAQAVDLHDRALLEESTEVDGVPIVADVVAHGCLFAKLAELARAQAWGDEEGMISESLPERLELEKSAAAKFMREALPRIASWPEAEIERDPDVPDFDILKEEPVLAMHLAESVTQASGGEGDWFDLAAKVTIAGRSATLAEIMAAIAAGELTLFLADGSMIDLTQPFFVKLKDLMRESAQLPDPVTGMLKVSRFQAGWWDELTGLGIVEKQAASWEQSVGALLDVKTIPKVAAPKKLQAVLRPYQQDGLAWLAFLREHRLGGILADDMGLGKTVQAIAFMCVVVAKRGAARTLRSKDDARPFLIVAPTSVVENWDAEIARFAPHLRVVVLRAGDRSELYDAMGSVDVVLTSYALLWRDEEQYRNVVWDTIILDEAQQVKNHQSRAYAIIRKLSCRCRFALTGTPLENNTMELWSLCSIVAPGLFPPPERFRETFQRPIEKLADQGALANLRRRVRPFILRRKKELVEKDLPAKTESVVLLDMEPAQRAIYDLFLQKSRQKVLGLLASGGFREHRFEILTALTRLRQLCLHPALVEQKHADAPSAKLAALLDYLVTIIAEGHKVLVFSQFTSFLALAREVLDGAGIAYAYLDGSTRKRAEPIERFRKDSGVNVFLISLKAGGTGLNLTAADYCILLDPWWNPAVENQAIARAHRIGQSRSVTAYRFITKDTIEEKVLKLQDKKRHLFENIIEEGDAFGSLITEADIRGLF